MTVPRLYLNHIAEFDWLIALEFGRVDEYQPRENWRGVSESFGFLHDGPGGPVVGFKILDFSESISRLPRSPRSGRARASARRCSA